jgi:hypothetical protein
MEGLSRWDRLAGWFSRRGRNLLRYALLGVALLAAYHFFVPFLDLPTWQLYRENVPVLTADTESQTALVNAMDAIIMTVAAFLLVKI